MFLNYELTLKDCKYYVYTTYTLQIFFYYGVIFPVVTFSRSYLLGESLVMPCASSYFD